MIPTTLDIYSKECESMLKFVRLVANLYSENIYDSNNMVRFVSGNVPEEIKKQKTSKLGNIAEIFASRYNSNQLTSPFSFQDYQKDHAIQSIISELNLNEEQFYFLLLFAFDYCESLCFNGYDVAYSANEQLSLFINSIFSDLNSFTEKDGATLKRPAKIELKIEGEKTISITNPTAIVALADTIAAWMEEENTEEDFVMNYREPLEDSSKIMNTSPTIAYFARMILTFLDSQKQVREARKAGSNHSKKEMELVSRLIYFTKLSTNDNWKYPEDNYLKAFLKQYKNQDLTHRISNIYPFYII